MVKKKVSVVAGEPGLILPVALLAGLILLQITPLPPALLRLLSPAAARAWASEPAGFLSLDPHATRAAAVQLLTTLTVFFLLLRVVETWARAERVMIILIGLGFGLALFGMVQQFTDNGRLYWVRSLQDGGGLYGPFVNRNHFAGYIGMIVPLALGAFAHVQARLQPRRTVGWQARMAWLGSPRGTHALFFGLATIVMITAIALTGSRGGLAGLLGAFAFLVVRSSMMRSGRHSPRAVLLSLATIFLIAVLMMAWVGRQHLVARWTGKPHQAFSLGTRAVIWSESLPIVRDFPLFGTGAGSFEQAFSRYQRTLITSGLLRAVHAENEYLQLTVEVGLLGVGLVGWLVAATVRSTSHVARGWFQLGAWGGCVAVLLHSVVDFPLRIPALTFLFITLLAMIMVGQTRREVILKSGLARGLPVLVSVSVALILMTHGLAFNVGAHYAAQGRHALIRGRAVEATAVLLKAAAWDSGNPQAHAALAEGYLRAGSNPRLSQASAAMLFHTARREAEQAAALQPTNGWHHLALSFIHARLAETEPGPHRAIAERELATAKALAPAALAIQEAKVF